jgi:hypothetical protein
MYLTRSELTALLCIGAGFLAGGLALLAHRDYPAATTLLLATLSVLGIYLWYERQLSAD